MAEYVVEGPLHTCSVQTFEGSDAVADGGSSCPLRAFVEEYFDFAWRTLRRFGIPEPDLEDAVQEVWIIVARKRASILPGRERAFVFGTAGRVASNYRRRCRRRPQELGGTLEHAPCIAQDPEEIAQLQHARPILQGILDRMTDTQRAVFVLCDLEDQAPGAVATMLGIPVGTVNSRLHRAREIFNSAVKRLVERENLGHARP
ncbi:MAG TPA: sigma-70 family RNA polymerase sigma factor [Polyangiaceae bacterium]|nr:sigma-70 family RNA polymerase sigma factor [Polyangiaceae bacterium]